MEMVPCKLLFVYIRNLMSKRANIQKLMIVTSASNASNWILSSLENGICTVCSRVLGSTQGLLTNKVNTIHNKPLSTKTNKRVAERRDAIGQYFEVQMVKALTTPEDYFACWNISICMLERLGRIWGGHNGSIRVEQHWINLNQSHGQPIPSAWYWAEPNEKEFKNWESRMLAEDTVEIRQT